MGNNHRQLGFTIIEVMLFLAVSAALAMAIFIGSGVAIGNQRYRDALNSFQSLIQQQYNEVANVVNTRDDNQSCNDDGISVYRGGSNCYIVGKAIVIRDRKNIEVSNIRGSISAADEQNLKNIGNDLEALSAYNYRVDTSTTESSEIAWSATLVEASDPTTILILSSPLSGTIRTFVYQGRVINESTNAIVNNFEPGKPTISKDYMTETQLCLDQAAFTTASRLGVVIRAGAAGANGVELTTDDRGCNEAA